MSDKGHFDIIFWEVVNTGHTKVIIDEFYGIPQGAPQAPVHVSKQGGGGSIW